MTVRILSAFVCCVVLVGTYRSLAATPQASAASAPIADKTELSIVVKKLSSPTAALHWRLYVSAAALPGFSSGGESYRSGVAEQFGDPARIVVGDVPKGTYFAIVGQDLDGDTEIAAFSEPRGYSGYDGCLLPDWDKGAQRVSGKRASIEVLLRCNPLSTATTAER